MGWDCRPLTIGSPGGMRPSEDWVLTPVVIKVPCRLLPSLGELIGPLAEATPANNPKPFEDSTSMAYLQQQPHIVLGADIAKDTIVISDGSTVWTIANQRRIIESFLKKNDAALVVCEPTGGYERQLLDACLRIGLPAHRADTLKVKAFMRSYGTLAKSDAIDALALAMFGQERWRRLALWQPADLDVEHLKALTNRRNELIAMRVAENNRSKAPGAKSMAASFKAVLAVIARQIKAVEAAIETLAAQSQVLKPRIAVCIEMSGIGTATATALLAAMPELGTLNRRQTAALAGLAPHPNESGKSIGYRKIRGGRPNVKTILFMPAMRAAAGHGPFAGFYSRLVKNGKKPIAAISAVMRKIVVTLNARLRQSILAQS